MPTKKQLYQQLQLNFDKSTNGRYNPKSLYHDSKQFEQDLKYWKIYELGSIDYSDTETIDDKQV